MSFKFLDNYNFIPFAHRGGSYEFCENTLDAFDNSGVPEVLVPAGLVDLELQ